MNIGYACLAIAVPGSEMKSCTLKNAAEEHLMVLVEHNIQALENMIDYNARHGIRLFRISSDLIPFGSSLAAEMPWSEHCAEKLKLIGEKIIRSGMRVSMHPGQYTVLNSPDSSVYERAVQDLRYHARVLDSLEVGAKHKIILHLGGVYGDKEQSKLRFLKRYQDLEPAIRNRLVLENDDKLYNIGDVLDTASRANIPVVFDNLHNAVNPPEEHLSEVEWIRRCAVTWRERDGVQKIHYSQQNPEKKPGAHSASIRVDTFLDFCRQLSGTDVDVMLEVKDKNISALKCLNTFSNRGIGVLEAEWGCYKYSVLERSPERYQTIRQLLKDKSMYPGLEMYRIIEASFSLPIEIGNAVNAAQHVWGYFKSSATESEKRRFQELIRKYTAGEADVQAIKKNLLSLARKYREEYLLNGYYFYI